MTTPLLAGYGPGDTLLVVHDGESRREITAARFVGAVVALASRLPRRSHALQRCERTDAFLVSTCAAWCAGQAVVMPPTRLDADRDALLERYPDAHVLDDALDLALDRAADHWPPPTLRDDLLAAILFTSGSTRVPREAAKTWGSLCRGARTFAEAFDIRPGAWTLAGTVSPQHMFGLEATVMAALHTGCALDATRPRFGTDLAALARANARAPPLCLATTPLHLEHFHRSPGPPPAVHRIIVSTMPIARALAADVERDWRARVDEIYGSTECGMIAARRPAQDDAFTPGDGLSLAIDDDGNAIASGAQLDAPVALDDRLAWRDEGRRAFALEGRKGDMVKVAGKRTTLAALGDHLRRIDGVEDGAFFPSAVQPGRLCALVVAPALDEIEVRRRLAERIDPAFMPRPLIRVERLPRDDRGKLALTELQRLIGEAMPSGGDE
ncbi:MAG TPA: AMP-binding protein, partial [Casimicrobiaceae bacterium]